jgi:hypothetical protein
MSHHATRAMVDIEMFGCHQKNILSFAAPPAAAAVTLLVLANSILCVAIPAIAIAPPAAQIGSTLPDYAGTWVRKVREQTFLVLTLKIERDQISGSLALPKSFNESQGGEVYSVSPEVNQFTVTQASVRDGHLELTTRKVRDPKDQDHYLMTLADHDHASIEPEGWSLAPWRLVRVNDSVEVSVATSWPEPGPKVISPEIAALQTKLRQMVAEDQAADTPPYSKFDEVCEKNYPVVLHIYEKYGWPRISVVGRQAASDFWLLAVHQTRRHLEFAKRALQDMQHAVEAGEASKANYALFEDSVLQAEGKPQHWGTKTVCKDGKRVLYPVDDPSELEQRRNGLQLQPLGKYLKGLPPCEK